jgi:hypothetical protein
MFLNKFCQDWRRRRLSAGYYQQEGCNMSDYITNSSLKAAALSTTSFSGARRSGSGNWFESFAQAWGTALDKQANTISDMSDKLAAGGDKPSDITMLSAESMRMSFMSTSSHTSLESISKALETMARKG